MNSELSEQLREYFERRRSNLLSEIDGLERLLGISPRTSELRKRARYEDTGKTLLGFPVVIDHEMEHEEVTIGRFEDILTK